MLGKDRYTAALLVRGEESTRDACVQQGSISVFVPSRKAYLVSFYKHSSRCAPCFFGRHELVRPLLHAQLEPIKSTLLIHPLGGRSASRAGCACLVHGK